MVLPNKANNQVEELWSVGFKAPWKVAFFNRRLLVVTCGEGTHAEKTVDAEYTPSRSVWRICSSSRFLDVQTPLEVI